MNFFSLNNKFVAVSTLFCLLFLKWCHCRQESFPRGTKKDKSVNNNDYVQPTCTSGSISLGPSKAVPPFCIHNEDVYEMSQTLMSRRILTPFQGNDKYITLDIGSAFGWYANYWAKLGFDVHAFEPGNAGPLLAASGANGFTDKITVNNFGIGFVGNHGSGASLKDSTLMKSKSLEGTFPKNKEVAMVKIDVEGSEMGVLLQLLHLVKKGVKVYNIIVEMTPKWWPNKEHGMHILSKFLQHNFTFVTSPWSEHATRVGKPPHGLEPNGISFDWEREPLLFAQKVPPEKLIAYVDSIKYQRDFWIQSPDTPFPLDFAVNEIGDLQCEKADEWKYHKMPGYLSDKRNIEVCLDMYHPK